MNETQLPKPNNQQPSRNNAGLPQQTMSQKPASQPVSKPPMPRPISHMNKPSVPQTRPAVPARPVVSTSPQARPVVPQTRVVTKPVSSVDAAPMQ